MPVISFWVTTSRSAPLPSGNFVSISFSLEVDHRSQDKCLCPGQAHIE